VPLSSGALNATALGVTLDGLLSDAVMAPVLRSAGYEPDEFREMMTEMAWNLVTPSEGGASLLTEEPLGNQIKYKLFGVSRTNSSVTSPNL
jgi:hypothetical protein